MDETKYKELVEAASDGRVVVEVDRVFARKLYTTVPMDTISGTIGEVPYFDKGVVCSAYVVSPVALVIGIALFAVGLHWWAVLIAPIAILLWLGHRARSATRAVGVGFPTLWLVAAVAVVALGWIHNPWVAAGLVVFVLALWCDRLLYVSAAHFLRAQVFRNQRAFEAYAEGVVIRHLP